MILYHYTSNEGLLEILRGLSIRASDLSLSNDSLEGRWVRHRLQAILSLHEIQEKHPGLNGRLGEFLEGLDRFIDLIGAVGFCMSTESDLLSQWRGYADGGRGVAIGFNQEYLQKLCVASEGADKFRVKLTEIDYVLSSQDKSIRAFLDQILPPFLKSRSNALTAALASPQQKEDIEQAYRMFQQTQFDIVPLLFSLKNPAFKEEREHRLVMHTVRLGDYMGEQTALEYRATSDKIIPFQRIALRDLKLPAISEIVLGPKNTTPDVVMQGLLYKNKMGHAKVRKSNASLQ